MLRKSYILALSLFLYIQIHAQPDSLPIPDDSIESAKPMMQIDQMPYFKGCTSLPEGSVEKRNCSNQSLISFISKNLEIPQTSEETGVVYTIFTIDKRGKVVEPSILRGLSNQQNEAALLVIKVMPDWEPARLNGSPIKVQMTLPIRFMRKDESELSNGFQLTWGQIKGANTDRKMLYNHILIPITVRDESGNTLEINELLFERERRGRYSDAKSRGSITQEMQQIVKRLKRGDKFTVTATVQKKGQFFYVDKSFIIE